MLPGTGTPNYASLRELYHNDFSSGFCGLPPTEPTPPSDQFVDWVHKDTLPRVCMGNLILKGFCWNSDSGSHHFQKLPLPVEYETVGIPSCALEITSMQVLLDYYRTLNTTSTVTTSVLLHRRLLRTHKITSTFPRSWSLSEGVSVNLLTGQKVQVKEFLVHRDNSGRNHAWLEGTIWNLHDSAVDNLRYSVLVKTPTLRLFPCISVESTFLTSHCCVLTTSEKDHHRSMLELPAPPLCWLSSQKGVQHNALNKLYFKKPDWI